MKRDRWWMTATAVAVALMAGFAIAASARPKQILSAQLNGRRFKVKNKHVDAGLPGSLGISITGGTPVHFRRLAKAMVVTCVSGLESATFPAQGQTCYIGYTETNVAKNISRQWGAPYGDPSVTFMSFDGTHVKGTFSGTMEPLTGTTESISVTNGQFDVTVP